MLPILLPYYTLISLTTLIAWGYDKYQATRQGWRVPEKTLLGLTIFGGFPGALLGMQLFRHKTRKTYFLLVALASGLAHTILVFILL